MSVVAIVQARMGSTRYPGKTLADLEGKTLVERVLDRIAGAKTVEQIVVATTQEPGDDAVEETVLRAGFACSRGSSEDVLDRYIHAARKHGATMVVRNTADEPFLDPALIDECVEAFKKARPDYASNNLRVLYPEGIDTEVVSMEALEIAWREATRPSDREHVTPFVWRQPERFRLLPVGETPLRPDFRLTVDYPQDLEFARAVYRELGGSTAVGDVVALLESRPDLLALCPPVPRREGYQKSVSEE